MKTRDKKIMVQKPTFFRWQPICVGGIISLRVENNYEIIFHKDLRTAWHFTPFSTPVAEGVITMLIDT